ncbi:MAG: DUF1574 family protein [Candidatus Melainabacteria bacterium]|nr:DUF1574 family protein [Candidatus Melainabacteria bacterium]
MSKTDKNQFKTVVTKSRALAVIGLVLAVNLALSLTNPFAKTSIEELPKDHSWISWSVHDYASQTKAPDVVYVGSSLLLHPLTMLDAHHLKKPMDYADHHRSVYTEERIAAKVGIPSASCFNFAMPGGMISDDWMIVESVLTGKRKPKVIVLGLCARDFMDNKVRCPGVTPTFKYLSKLINIDPIVDLALPNIMDRTDYLIGKVAYLWQAKPVVQGLLSDVARRIAGGSSGAAGGNGFTPEQLDKLLTADMASELERGMLVEPPDRERQFSDNTKEYSERYKSRHDSLFKVEKQFFDKLLDTAKKNDVRVVVVNMPLTSLNVRMMPPGIYDEYLEAVRTSTEKRGFVFANLNDDTKFPSSLFYDTVHMNSVGGQRLVDAVVDVIYQDKICIEKLRQPEANGSGIADGGSPTM